MLTLIYSVLSLGRLPVPQQGRVGIENHSSAPSAERSPAPESGASPTVRAQSPAVGVVLAGMAAMRGGDGPSQASDRSPMAPRRFLALLALAFETRAAASGWRDS